MNATGEPTIRAPLPVSIQYVPQTSVASRPIDRPILAAIGFGEAVSVDDQHTGHFGVGIPQLAGEPVAEVWTSRLPVKWQTADAWTYGVSDDAIFGYCLTDDSATGIEATTFQAYQQLLALLRREGFANLLRVWHYFPHINAEEAGLERYRAFNRGRAHALESAPEIAASLPASTAVGTACPGFLVYFLASRLPIAAIENPRQVSAFLYPAEYGPRSPSFSRATVVRDAERPCLFVSGTASIVGHETTHEQSALAQLDEILINLDALMQEAQTMDPRIPSTSAGLSSLKVYVRSATDVTDLRQRLEQRFRRHTDVLFLRADICRLNLHLEIEGAYFGGYD
jgi:chorismate lyase/3-hydroxybenzoate synthase